MPGHTLSEALLQSNQPNKTGPCVSASVRLNSCLNSLSEVRAEQESDWPSNGTQTHSCVRCAESYWPRNRV